jgi:hypothetical protein
MIICIFFSSKSLRSPKEKELALLSASQNGDVLNVRRVLDDEMTNPNKANSVRNKIELYCK